MPVSSVGMNGRSRNWKTLPQAHLDRKLTTLGLHLDRTERVIICIQCKYSLQPSGEAVSKHLWEKHKVPAEARRGLNPFVRSLQLPDPNKLDLRHDGCAPHPYLAIQSGAACKRCNYRSTSLDLMQRHLSKQCGRKADRKNWLRDEIRTDLMLQSWSQNGARGYWIVKSNECSSPPTPVAGTSCSPRRQKRLAALHEKEEQRIADSAHIHTATDTGIDDLAFTSNWMRRTGWPDTFAGTDRCLLGRLTDVPAEEGHSIMLGLHRADEIYSSADDERRLAAIGRAVDHFFDRCEDTARNTDHSIRCWLRSQVVGHPYKAPFELPARESTRKWYRLLWKKLLLFIVRLYRLDNQVREELLGVRLSGKQRKAVEQVWLLSQPGSASPAGRLQIRDSPSPILVSTTDDEPGSQRNDSRDAISQTDTQGLIIRGRNDPRLPVSLTKALPLLENNRDKPESRPASPVETGSDSDYEASGTSDGEGSFDEADTRDDDFGLTRRPNRQQCMLRGSAGVLTDYRG